MNFQSNLQRPVCIVVYVYNCRLIQHPHLSTLLGIVRLEGDKIAVITPLVRGSNLHVIFGDNHRKVC